MQLVIFDTLIRPYQVLPFRTRLDLGAMVMKECSAFSKAPASDCSVSSPRQTLVVSYPSAEVQSMYSTAPTN